MTDHLREIRKDVFLMFLSNQIVQKGYSIYLAVKLSLKNHFRILKKYERYREISYFWLPSKLFQKYLHFFLLENRKYLLI